MIIRISLLLILAALPVFLIAELLLRLSMSGLAATCTALAAAILLCGFGMLIGAILLSAFKVIIRSAVDYCSARQRAQRRLWFAQARKEQVKCLFYFKTRQLKYFNELRRKRLLMSNNRKHIRLLARSIDNDLAALKAKLPSTAYQQLRQDNIRYRKRQDIEALLQLQQKISTLF